MKVLCLTNNLDKPEAFLLLGLQAKGIDITLVLDQNSPFQEILKNSGISCLYHTFNNRVDPKSIMFVFRLLKEQKFDIIHSFSGRALTSALLASWRTNIKHVGYRGTIGHVSRIDPTSWISFLHPRLTKVICVSNAVRQYLLGKGLSQEKVVRIYKGQDVSWYNYSQPFDLKLFGIPENAFVVSCGANVRPVKGVDVLIEAFRSIPEELPIHLLLIGEIRDSKVKHMLEHHPAKEKIHVTGFRQDAPYIMGATSLACMPSRNREGLSKSLIESMAQGLPALITNVGGMPEVVINGECGIIVPPEDPQALSLAIIKLYKDPLLRKLMGIKAKQRIIDHFSIESTVSETLAVYQECFKS